MLKKSFQISRGDTCVYVIKHKGKSSIYKIGKSADFHQRFETIQSYNAAELEIILIKKTDFHDYIEKILHFEFKSKKIRGEWFDLSKEDIIKLKDIASNINSIEYLQANYEKIYHEMVKCGEFKSIPNWEDISPARDRNKNPKYNKSDIHIIREILHLERQKLQIGAEN
jgi:hypothetical protein